MAYPTVSVPYGFKPVNLLGGQVYAGSTRQMAITSAHTTAIFFGDVVIMSANGCITGCVTTSSAVNVAGIFQGCSYVNSLGQRIYAQFYPGAITGTVDGVSGITAYVADDPDLVMKVAIQSAADALPSASQALRSALVGGNVSIVYQSTLGVGSTQNGDGTQGVLNAGVALSTAPIKIIDVVPDTAISGSFVEVLVTWNQNIHMYRSWTGMA